MALLSKLLARWHLWSRYRQPIGQLTTLYAKTDGYALSQQDRRQRDAIEYTYGEIDWWGFAALLSQLTITEQDIFYDLGSGLGKAVAITAMITPVKKSIGIELLPSLHQASQDLLINIPRTELIAADYLVYDWSDASIVFINATSLFGPTWTALVEKLKLLSPGAQIILTSKKLPATHFTPTYDGFAPMSWGSVSARIYNVVGRS